MAGVSVTVNCNAFCHTMEEDVRKNRGQNRSVGRGWRRRADDALAGAQQSAQGSLPFWGGGGTRKAILQMGKRAPSGPRAREGRRQTLNCTLPDPQSLSPAIWFLGTRVTKVRIGKGFLWPPGQPGEIGPGVSTATRGTPLWRVWTTRVGPPGPDQLHRPGACHRLPQERRWG